jgi:hypothetical protein
MPHPCMYVALGKCSGECKREPTITVNSSLSVPLELPTGTKGRLCKKHQKICQCSVRYGCTKFNRQANGVHTSTSFWDLSRKSMSAAQAWQYEAIGVPSKHGVVDQIDGKTTTRVCKRCATDIKALVEQQDLARAAKSTQKKAKTTKKKKKKNVVKVVVMQVRSPPPLTPTVWCTVSICAYRCVKADTPTAQTGGPGAAAGPAAGPAVAPPEQANPVLFLKERAARIANNPRAAVLLKAGKHIYTQPVAAEHVLGVYQEASDLAAGIAFKFEKKPGRKFVSVAVDKQHAAIMTYTVGKKVMEIEGAYTASAVQRGRGQIDYRRHVASHPVSTPPPAPTRTFVQNSIFNSARAPTGTDSLAG